MTGMLSLESEVTALRKRSIFTMQENTANAKGNTTTIKTPNAGSFNIQCQPSPPKRIIMQAGTTREYTNAVSNAGTNLEQFNIVQATKAAEIDSGTTPAIQLNMINV